METAKRWVVYIEKDGKPQYLSYIDTVGNDKKRGMVIRLSPEVEEAIKYRAEFRAKEDSDLLGWKCYREYLKEITGGMPFMYRQLSEKEAKL